MSDPRGAAGAGSPYIVFSIVFGIVYSLCFYYNWPLFAYYPQVNEFHLATQIEANGPPILWYGWMATAGLVSAAIAVLVPRGVVARLWHGWAWVGPAGAAVAIVVYETRWFR